MNEERAVPVFREAPPEAKQRLLSTSKGSQQRQIYRENLARLNEGKMLEIQPEGEETLRKLKVNVRRAANELSIPVAYGETSEGTLLVWSEPQQERGGRRGRPRRSGDATESSS